MAGAYGVFSIVANDGMADRMLMATELLNSRIHAIVLARLGPRPATETLPSWRIERVGLKGSIARASGMIPDLCVIVADYIGSLHEAALEAIWTRPVGIVADCILLRSRASLIDADSLIKALRTVTGYPDVVLCRESLSAADQLIASVYAHRLIRSGEGTLAESVMMLDQLYGLLLVMWPEEISRPAPIYT